MPNLTAHISSFRHVGLQQFHEFFTLPAAALKPKRVKAEYASTIDPIFVSRGRKGGADNVLSNVVADFVLYFSDSPVNFQVICWPWPGAKLLEFKTKSLEHLLSFCRTVIVGSYTGTTKISTLC